MKCALCTMDFNDGVQCGVCKKHLDFGCALIAETSWRKLGASKRAAWKCPLCRSTSPVPEVEDPVTLELVFKEIRGLKSQLLGLPALIADVQSIKDELTDLKNSQDFIHAKICGLAEKSEAVDERVLELQNAVSTLQSELVASKAQNLANEQRSRLNNVEIKGVPMKKDENLFNIVSSISRSVDFGFEKAQVNYIYRVPTHSSKEKSIILSFLNRYVKEDFVAAARTRKALIAADIGFSGSQQRVYVNDHLAPESKILLTKCKAKAKEKNFNYCWVKFTFERMTLLRL